MARKPQQQGWNDKNAPQAAALGRIIKQMYVSFKRMLFPTLVSASSGSKGQYLLDTISTGLTGSPT